VQEIVDLENWEWEADLIELAIKFAKKGKHGIELDGANVFFTHLAQALANRRTRRKLLDEEALEAKRKMEENKKLKEDAAAAAAAALLAPPGVVEILAPPDAGGDNPSSADVEPSVGDDKGDGGNRLSGARDSSGKTKRKGHTNHPKPSQTRFRGRGRVAPQESAVEAQIRKQVEANTKLAMERLPVCDFTLTERKEFDNRIMRLPNPMELDNLKWIVQSDLKFHLICMDKPYGTMKQKGIVLQQDLVETYKFKEKAQLYFNCLEDGGNVLLRVNWIHAPEWRTALFSAGFSVEDHLLTMCHPAKFCCTRNNSWHQRIRSSHTWIVAWKGSSEIRYTNLTRSGWLPDNTYPPGAAVITEVPFPTAGSRLKNFQGTPYRIQVCFLLMLWVLFHCSYHLVPVCRFL
jgi:hypothetical protein